LKTRVKTENMLIFQGLSCTAQDLSKVKYP
jgi:hypothetical protein